MLLQYGLEPLRAAQIIRHELVLVKGHPQPQALLLEPHPPQLRRQVGLDLVADQQGLAAARAIERLRRQHPAGMVIARDRGHLRNGALDADHRQIQIGKQLRILRAAGDEDAIHLISPQHGDQIRLLLLVIAGGAENDAVAAGRSTRP